MTGFLVMFDTYIQHLPFSADEATDTHDVGFQKRRKRKKATKFKPEQSTQEEEELALRLLLKNLDVTKVLEQISEAEDFDDNDEWELVEKELLIDVNTNQVFEPTDGQLEALRMQEDFLTQLSLLDQQTRDAELKARQDLIVWLVAHDEI